MEGFLDRLNRMPTRCRSENIFQNNKIEALIETPQVIKLEIA